MISGINTWAVSVLRYSTGIVDWKMEELLAWIEELGKFFAKVIVILRDCTCRGRKEEEG